MSRRSQKEDGLQESAKTTPSKKSKAKKSPSTQTPKIDLQKLSQAFYSKQPQESLSKIVFFDNFEGEEENLEGAMTSRYLPVEGDGSYLERCPKVDNLNPKKEASGKKKSKEEQERKLAEGRSRKK